MAMEAQANLAEIEGEADALGSAAEPPAAPAISPGEGNYQGLPARISPPRTFRQVGFQQGLIDEKSQIEVSGFFLNKNYLDSLELLLTLLLFGWALYRRERFLDFLRG